MPASPGAAVLERVPNPHPRKVYLARFAAPEFTSLCPITGQPDFAHLVIDYAPGQVAGREQVAEALPRQLPQPRRVPRGLHARDRRPARSISCGRAGCASAATGIRAAACRSTCSGRPGARPLACGCRTRACRRIAAAAELRVTGMQTEDFLCQGEHVQHSSLFSPRLAATLFAGAVVADMHAAPAAGTATQAGSPGSSPPGETPAKRAAVIRSTGTRPDLVDLSDRIWAYAETALRETSSAAALADYAEQQGFKVERGVAGMPTAFVATYGSGRPVIGIMGEYDALPGVSQKASPVQEPLRQAPPATAAATTCSAPRASAPPSRSRSRSPPASSRARCGSTARPPRKTSAARSTWRARACSTTSTRCSRGTRATRRRPTWRRARRWSA